MFELRFVVGLDGDFQLQQRNRTVMVNTSGAFCDFTTWSEWSSIPIHYGVDFCPRIEVGADSVTRISSASKTNQSLKILREMVAKTTQFPAKGR